MRANIASKPHARLQNDKAALSTIHRKPETCSLRNMMASFVPWMSCTKPALQNGLSAKWLDFGKPATSAIRMGLGLAP